MFPKSIQRGKTGFAGFIEQLGNPLALFLIEGRDKTFPKTLLRAVPDAADKALKDADAQQKHLVDDQPGRGALDQRAGTIVPTPAQRIKPPGQAKSGRCKFRKTITLTDQHEMSLAFDHQSQNSP